MTSTWITFAPTSSTSRTWAPSFEKSAARIDGATRVTRAVAASYLEQHVAPQLPQVTIEVCAMRTIVECSPQFGQTETSSKRCRQ